MEFIETSVFTRQITELINDFLFAYPKNKQDNLSRDQKKTLVQVMKEEWK